MGDDKMYVAGVLCDFFNNAPIHMSKYLNESLKLCEVFLKDTNDCVKRNTAFLLGLICESCKDRAQEFYKEVCLLLEPLTSSKKKEVKDNAIAALARMVFSNEMNVPNCEQVTEFIINNSPFTGDYQENPTI